MQILNDDDIGRILYSLEADSDIHKLFFCTVLYTGLKASFVKDLRWSFYINDDFTLKTSYDYGGNTFGFNDELVKVVSEFIRSYNIQDVDSYVFVFNNKKISPSDVWRIIYKSANVKVTDIIIRRTWGRKLFENSENKMETLLLLRRCLNRASDKLTLQYIGVLDADVSKNKKDVSIYFIK